VFEVYAEVSNGIVPNPLFGKWFEVAMPEPVTCVDDAGAKGEGAIATCLG